MKKAVPVVLFLLIVAGCQAKLNSESTVKVELMDKNWTTVDPSAKAQKVNVSAKADSGQFNIYFYLEKDKAEVEKEVDQSKTPAKALAQQTKATQADLSANIPANERAVVLITSGDGKKAEVKLKISN